MTFRFGMIVCLGALLFGFGSTGFAQKRRPAARYVVVGDINTACVRSPDANRSRPTQISGGILNTKALDLPEAEGVLDTGSRRIRGSVYVQVLVGEDGSVISASGVSGDKRLHPSAVFAARRARFGQTFLNGAPVKVTGVIFYKF